jgi:steroid delta-isomerase-like uncharacterized protein
MTEHPGPLLGSSAGRPIDERRTMSTAEETANKETFKRFQDVTNTHDPELISQTIDEIVEPNVVIRTQLPVEATGAAALKEVFARLHQVFPDLHVTVEDMVAEGDKVAGRNSVSGTHQRDFMGHPPTGKSVVYNEIFIFRFAGGRIAETWGVVDVFSQLKQLGVTTV